MTGARAQAAAASACATQPANIKSVSKAVIAALVGIAIARGVFTGPDQRIAPLLADRLPRNPDPRRRGTPATDAGMILLPTPNRRPTLRRELSPAERPTHVRIAAAADQLHVHRRHLQEFPGPLLGARFRRGPLL
jgi:hypothetical protein